MEKFDELRHCLQGLDKAMETKKKKRILNMFITKEGTEKSILFGELLVLSLRNLSLLNQLRMH